MKRILVLDDDVDILHLVKTILTMNGYAAEIISHWEHLDTTIEKFYPDLILLDISLSGANGIDICRELKKDERRKHIPVVLFSANVEMVKKADECEANGYLSKPFAIKDLLAVLNEHI